MADLDEISVMLGEMRSDIKHVLIWQESHEENDQERFRQLAAGIERSNHIKDRVDCIEEDIAEFKPTIAGLQNAKWMIVGALIVIAVAGGTVGALAQTAIKLF